MMSSFLNRSSSQKFWEHPPLKREFEKLCGKINLSEEEKSHLIDYLSQATQEQETLQTVDISYLLDISHSNLLSSLLKLENSVVEPDTCFSEKKTNQIQQEFSKAYIDNEYTQRFQHIPDTLRANQLCVSSLEENWKLALYYYLRSIATINRLRDRLQKQNKAQKKRNFAYYTTVLALLCTNLARVLEKLKFKEDIVESAFNVAYELQSKIASSYILSEKANYYLRISNLEKAIDTFKESFSHDSTEKGLNELRTALLFLWSEQTSPSSVIGNQNNTSKMIADLEWWISEQAEKWEYDLVLLFSNSEESLPETRKSLIVVDQIQKDFSRIRVFDRDGKQFVFNLTFPAKSYNHQISRVYN